MTVTHKSGGNGIMGAALRARRMLQGAVLVAVAASVPAAWGAGGGVQGVQVNSVAAGSAAISRAGDIMTIRTQTNNTIINYQRLSVASGETLQFLQPNANSRVLNRIQGNEPSVIDGTLYSNGKVYLVNPAGVMFGNGSVINVSGFFAAAGHISDSNFLSGVNQFTGNTGAVVNYGTIQAGDIHLVGGSVANFGSIMTTGSGVVTMTAGKDVYIGETDSPTGGARVLVKVSSDKGATKEGTGVSNSGTVDAGGGEISMGAGDLYAAGIYNNGSLKAAKITSNSGASTNVNEGRMDASSATGKGGSVEMVGDKVGVFAGTVDASGATGGGSIKIGGDFHGAPGTLASSVTIISPGALITADARNAGDGGTVAIWSDQVTEFYGTVSARGGIAGGNGGFVEISGKKNLAFNGMADVSAPGGVAGTILFDPQNIIINNATSGTDNGVLTPSFTTTGNHNYTFSATAIQALSGAVTLTAADDISVNASLNLVGTGVTSFTLAATAGDINVAGGVQIVGNTQAITLNAGHDIFMADTGGSSAEIRTTTGAILLAATHDIVMQASNGDAFAAKLTSVGGAVELRAGNGILLDSGNGGAARITTGGGSLTLRSAGGMTLEGNSSTVHVALSSTGSGVGGAILISTGDSLLGGTTGNIAIGSSVTIDSGGGNITFRATDLAFTSHNQTISAGTGVVAFEPNNSINTIGLEQGAGTLTIDNDVADRITSASLVRIGVNGSQSGAISVRNFILAGIPLEINSNFGAGSVSFNDATGGNGVTVNDNLTVRAGTGGILVANTTNGNPEINFTGFGKTLTLESAGGIGDSTHRLEIFNFASLIGVSNTSTGSHDVFITGLGVSAGLTFSGISNAANVTDIISAGDINASGLITGTNVILNASGGIGTTGPVPINASGASTLTSKGSGSSGNITVLTTLATFGTFTFVTSGTGTQTVTIDSAGDLSLGAGVAAPAGDALVVNASGNLFAAGAALSGVTVSLNSGLNGTGNLNAGGVTIAGNSIFLKAGTGAGASSVIITGATFSGSTLALPALVQIEQDGGFASLPSFGTATALSIVSHLGSVGINTNQDLLSLAVSGTTIVLTANATASGAMNFTGLLLLGGNTTLVGGSSLTVTGAIASQASSGFTLRTHFGGVTTFTGGVSTVSGDELGSLTVDAAGGSLVVGSGTSAALRTTGSVLIGEPLLLNGALTVTSTGGGSVRFNSTIDSAGSPHSPLIINTTGTTTFDGDVGVGTAVGGVTVLGGGAVTLGNASSSGFAMTVGSPILFTGPVTLVTNTTLTATGGTTGTVTFQSTVVSASSLLFNLTVNASDAVTFGDNIGDLFSGAIGTLTITSGAGTQIFLGNATLGSMGVTAFKQDFHSPVTLLSDVSFVAFGDITFDEVISSGTASHSAVTFNSINDIILTKGTSTASATLLQSILSGGNGVTRFGAGTVNVKTIGSQTYNNDVELGGNTTFQVTGTGSTLAFAGSSLAIDAGAFDLTLISNSMSFSGTGNSVTGTGHLTLLPLTSSDNILIQAATGSAANTLVLGASDMAAFSGFTLTTLGYPEGSGTISVTATTIFGSSTLIQSPSGGSIIITSPILADGSLTLHADSINLGASVFTVSSDLTLEGSITLTGGPITLQSFFLGGSSGNITVIGSIDGGQVLNLFANGPGGDGAIDLQGVVGGNVPLTGLNVSGGAMTVQANITTVGAVNIGAANLFLHHAGTGGTSTVAISTSGNVLNISSPIDGDGTGSVNLIVSTSTSGVASAITLSSVGASGTINNLTIIAVGGVVSAPVTLSDVTINGSLVSSGGGFLSTGAINTFGAGGITIAHQGDVEFDDILDAHGNPVTINGAHIFGIGDINGTVVSITDTAGAEISGIVTATGGFTSSGAGTNYTQSGSILTSGGSVTIAHAGGNVGILGDITAGTGSILITGAAITTGPGTISGGRVTATGTGLMSVTGPILASSTLTLTGAGITTGTAGILTGAPVLIDGGAVGIALRAAVNATGGFSSTATSIFILLNTGSITTNSTNITINHTGLVSINGPISAGTATVTLTAGGVTEATTGAITAGALALSGTGTFAMQRPNAVGRLAADVTGSLTFGNTVDLIAGTVGLISGINTHGAALTLNASGHNLAATAPLLGGAIDLTADNITIGGGLLASGTAGVLTAIGAMIFNSTASAASIIVIGPSTVNADLVATAGSISLQGANTLNANMTASGNVALGALLTDVNNFSGSHFIVAGGSLALTGPMLLTGPGLTVLRAAGGGGVSIAGSISGAHALQVLATGGGIFVGGPIVLTGSGASSFVALNAVTASGSITSSHTLIMNSSSSKVLITDSLVLTGAGVTAINSGGAAGIDIGGSLTSSQTLALSSAGSIGIAGAVVLTGAGTTGMTSSGATGITLGSGLTSSQTLNLLANSGSIGIAGPVVLTGSGTSVMNSGTAAGIKLADELTSSQTLNLLATSGGIGITGPVVLTGSGTTGMTSSGATGITLGGGLTSSQPLNLLASSGSIGITGAVSLTGAGSTTLTAGGLGGVKINGGLTGSQKLTIITNHSAGAISLGAVGTGTGGRYTGLLTLTANSAGTINGVILNGDMFVDTVIFDGAHASVPTVATIAAPGNIVIDALTLFDMRANQKLTVLGSLTLRSHAPATDIGMFIGDIGALGTIVIDAGAPGAGAAGLGRINIRLRAPQAELGQNGLPLSNDGGTDLVSYSPTTVSAVDAGFGTGITTIAIRGNVSIIGVAGPVDTSTTKVQVVSATANLDLNRSGDGDPNPILLFPPDQGGVLTTTHGVPIIPRIIIANQNLDAQSGDISNIGKQIDASNGTGNQISAATLVITTGPFAGMAMDLVPTGTTGDSPTPSAQAALIPQDVQTLFPERGQAISGALAEALQQLGIYARPLDAEELVDELLGRGLYNDTLRVLLPLDSSHTVAVNRLPPMPVIIPVVEKARALMYREEKDELGKIKLVSKTDEVAAAIGVAWQGYQDWAGAQTPPVEPKPAEFRRYLEENEEKDAKFKTALGYLNQIQDLLTHIKQLGLTPTEYDVSQRVILNKLRDKDRIDEKDFAVMIDGPSSRVGSKLAVEVPAAKPATTQP